MSAMSEFAVEIADAVAGPAGDPVAMVDALLDGRIEVAALGPSGRVWVSGSPEAILDLVAGAGMGLVARLDRGPWLMVREVATTQPRESEDVTGAGHRSANGQVAESGIARIEGNRA